MRQSLNFKSPHSDASSLFFFLHSFPSCRSTGEHADLMGAMLVLRERWLLASQQQESAEHPEENWICLA